MTARERLRVLVDGLPDEDVERAERLLAPLAAPPLDDEPESTDERAAVAAAWEDVRAGRLISQDEIERELGLR